MPTGDTEDGGNQPRRNGWNDEAVGDLEPALCTTGKLSEERKGAKEWVAVKLQVERLMGLELSAAAADPPKRGSSAQGRQGGGDAFSVEVGDDQIPLSVVIFNSKP